MKPKIAVVVQRFGADVLGGSEEHCRKMVELLSDIYDFTVLTTTAKDYITWENHYKEGKDNLGNIPIIRFKVDIPRNIKEFNAYSEKFFSTPPELRDNDDIWFKRQGPYCPDLLKYLESNRDNYDGFLFFTYLYYNTVYGLPIVSNKSILVSTAHDEPPFYLRRINELFNKAGSIIFNTETEKDMIYRVHTDAQKKHVIGGYYIDTPDLKKIKAKPLKDKYILYFGRLERGKGVFELFDYFMLLQSYYPQLKLVCLGKKGDIIHPRHNIILPGFVSEEEKWAYIKNAEFVVMPSPHESLSITLLEGMSAGKPILVNGKCDVLVDHIKKSNAGYAYNNHGEFLEASRYLLENNNASKMKYLATDYIENYYSKQSMYNSYHEGIKIVVGK